jgi:tetratricopeptide (TPR) repeat protein
MTTLRLYIFLLLIYSPAVFAQNKAKVDSLKSALANDLTPQQKVKIYNQLAREFRYTDSVLVGKYVNAAIRWAKPDNNQQGIVDAYYHLGWNKMQLGDYPAAIKIYKKSIKIAHNINYYKGEANAYNGLGVTYGNKGDYTKALECHQKSLVIKRKIGYRLGLAYSYNNMGRIYRFQGDFAKSLEYHQKSLAIKLELKNQSGIAYSNNNIGIIYREQGNYPKAMTHLQRGLNIRQKINDTRGASLSYKEIGLLYYNQSNYAKALEFFEKALKINEAIGEKRELVYNYNSVGNIYQNQGKYAKALGLFEKTLKINEEIGDKSGIASSYLYLGRLALAQKNYDKAHSYFEKVLAMRQQMGQKALSAEVWINLGIAYFIQQEYKQAIEPLNKGVRMARQAGDPHIIKDGAEYLGKVYKALGNYPKAFENLELFKQMSDSLFNSENVRKIAQLEYKQREDSLHWVRAAEKAAQQKRQFAQRATLVGLVLTLGLLGLLLFFYYQKQRSNQELSKANEEIQLQQDKLQMQNTYLEQAYQNVQLLSRIGQEVTASLDLDKVLKTIYEHINQLMDATNFGIGIYSPQKEQVIFKLTVLDGKRVKPYVRSTANKNQFSVWSIDHNQAIKMGDVANEYVQYIKDIDDEVDRLSNELHIKLPQSAMYIPMAIQNKAIGIIAIHSYQEHAYSDYHFNLLKSLSLYLAVAIDNAQVYQQLDKKNEDMMASLHYAQKIQEATLPLDKVMWSYLPNHFVLYRPRDIVSGDFYWCDRDNHKTFIAVGDCTGHGVPGAFMTMLGVQALNHIIVHHQVHQPDLVLFCLDGILRQLLKSDNTLVRDGMCLSLAVIDYEKQELHYAGARQPLTMVQNGQIQEIKGDVFSINGHRKMNDGIEFTTHVIDISQPTTVYMYSDGYQDQFGGITRKKFMKRQLRELFLEVSPYAMPTQKQILDQRLDTWMDKQEQIDDILVVGIQLFDNE